MPPGDVLGPLMLEYWHTGEQDLETEWSPRQALSASPQFSPSFDHGQDHNYTSIPTSHGLPRWCYVKILPANAGDVRDADLTPGLGRSLEDLSPFSLPDRDRRVDSPVWSGWGSWLSRRTSGGGRSHEDIRDEPRGWGHMPNDPDSPAK